MDAKTYLIGVRNSVKRLPVLEQKKSAALDRATSCTVTPDVDSVRSTATSRAGELYVEMTEADDEEIGRINERVREASAMIAKIPDETSRDVLDLYYIRALPWWRVAEILDKSYKYTVHNLHIIALKNFSECNTL